MKEIAKRFGRAAEYYHQHAEIPRKVAAGLAAALTPWKEILPPGPILEIGCGTGFLTRHILELYPDREILVTDASPDMLRYCEQKLAEEGLLRDTIRFEIFDVDRDEIPDGHFSMITGNFVPQWFIDAGTGLDKLTKNLQSGGLLLVSFPGEQSFKEWYETCLELGLPFTAHPLPNVERVGVALSLGPQQIDYYENDLYQEFESALDFFRHLKFTGASFTKLGKSLSSKQFRLLLRHWDAKSGGKVRVKWHIAYLAAKKD